MLWFLLCVTAGLALWARWRVKNRSLLACARRVPGPPTLPMLGNAWEFIVPSEQIFNVIGDLKKKYGNIFRFWLGPDLNFCVSDPDDIKVLLQSNKTSAKGPQYKYMTDFLGDGILSGSGPVWRKRRKIISPNYTRKGVESYSDVFNAEVSCLLDRLRTRASEESINVYEEVVKTTTYAVCQTLFGLTRDETLNLPYLQTIVDRTHELYLGAFMRMTTWYLQIELLYRLSHHYTTHKDFIEKSIAMSNAIVQHRLGTLQFGDKVEKDDRYNNNDDNNHVGTSTVDKLLLSNAIPDYEKLLQETFTIFTTSQETSANITSFLLLMMAYHPECQDKLYAEIKCVVGDADRPVTDEDIRRMPYLDMVFREVIRLFPIGSLLQRTVLEDIEISRGITLPSGSSLSVLIFHLHRDEQFWTSPEAFIPERFSPEECRLRHPGCYIPFSLGSMDCLGRHFGAKLVKTISTRVLREFRLTSPETYEDLKLVCAVSVESVNGYPVYLHSRNNQDSSEKNIFFQSL